MSLRWSRSLARPSGAEVDARGSLAGFDPCSDGCSEDDLRAAAFAISQHGGHRLASLSKREQETQIAARSTSSSQTTTSSGVATARPSTLSHESSPSSSTTATAAPSNNRPNVAAIAGAAAGGFVFLLLVGIVLYFWLHTHKSRRHHNRTFDRRSSDPRDAREMAQKQLVRVSIAAEGKSPAVDTIPVAHLINVAAVAAPHTRHQRTASHIYISPTTATERRASQHASRNIDADPSTYRHYSAEDFHLPQSPATAWKTSHRPTTWDLTRRSIGTFELDSPLTLEAYGAAMPRNSSVVSSLGSGSRKSSLKSGVSSLRGTGGVHVPSVPPVPPPPAATGAWDTHRRSVSTGVL